MNSYSEKIKQLKNNFHTNQDKLSLNKKSISNLFRYGGRDRKKNLDLSHFNQIIAVDEANATLEVEGLTTYETIVDACLAKGLLPTVTPELKHITIGGAIVGIGIESSSYRAGFVHDGLLAADVLLPDGNIVTCTADNEHHALFFALANSYGTLGYILSAKIHLEPAAPLVKLTTQQFSNIPDYLSAMLAATKDSSNRFVEGLFYSDNRYLLMTACFAKEKMPTKNIIRDEIFYQLASKPGEFYLKTKDYIFRYDYDWFWNIPETPFYTHFRKKAPLSMRNSNFYSRYTALKNKILTKLPWQIEDNSEPLIQDWQVPWDNAQALIECALATVDLKTRPWVAVPILSKGNASLYPMSKDVLYFNLGCYCYVEKPENHNKEAFWYTKNIDQRCFQLNGIKMLYSSSFLSKEAFAKIYNGAAYQELKSQYDPEHRAYTLYEKVANVE